MTHLVKIGNSQGIRIPKPLIKQTDFEGRELKLEVINGGLFISPVNNVREGWGTLINDILAIQGEEEFDGEWMDADLVSSDMELDW